MDEEYDNDRTNNSTGTLTNDSNKGPILVHLTYHNFVDEHFSLPMFSKVI